MDPNAVWLQDLAWACLALCAGCSLLIVADFIHGCRQKMWIMYVVWPVTALYFGPFALRMYFRTRAASSPSAPEPDERTKRQLEQLDPTREQIAVSVFHCGAGCTIGDIAGEVGLFFVGGSVARFLGGSEFATRLLVDFVLAYVIGIFFQYFTIVPMRGLGFAEGLRAAARADTISITAFEVGMFAWMALTRYVLFSHSPLQTDMVVSWFMMQIAMIVGWATSYPANLWLLRRRWKERMPSYPSRPVRQEHEILRRAA